MDELNLKELLNYFKRKIDVIFLTVILALLVGYMYVEYFQIPMYKGTTTIILVESNDNRVSDLVTQNEITVNEKLVTTYSEVIKSKRVLNRVIEDLELEISIEDLIETIQVSSVQDTAIIAIEVENENGEQAAIIANKIAGVFKEEITQIYNLENVSIIDEAVEEDKPCNVNLPLQFAVYGAIGGIIAAGMIFVMYYFNNTISSKQEIESKLNIPVIGEVPVTSILFSKNKKKKDKKKKSKNHKEKTKKTKSKEESSKDEDSTKLQITESNTKDTLTEGVIKSEISLENKIRNIKKKETKLTNKKVNEKNTSKKRTHKKEATTKKTIKQTKDGE